MREYKKEDFKNHSSGLTFIDISSEKERNYFFGEYGVVIYRPLLLNIGGSGHRIWDDQGVSHFIPNGWIHLFWTVKPGEPNFKF